MTDLEIKIREQLEFCKTINCFRSAIYVSSKTKLKMVIDLLLKIMEELSEGFVTSCGFGIASSNWVYKFTNGSLIKVVVANDWSMGNRSNGCVIDEEITDETKKAIVYPQLIPLVTNNKKHEFESWNNIKERVFEAHIEKDEL